MLGLMLQPSITAYGPYPTRPSTHQMGPQDEAAHRISSLGLSRHLEDLVSFNFGRGNSTNKGHKALIIFFLIRVIY